jgi:hypothetical protein
MTMSSYTINKVKGGDSDDATRRIAGMPGARIIRGRLWPWAILAGFLYATVATAAENSDSPATVIPVGPAARGGPLRPQPPADAVCAGRNR